ncbi:HotDog domain-containing protein [Cladochytrium replicatum]|nr:HotDog domain-containing protein [Cladochytrium replicatum]
MSLFFKNSLKLASRRRFSSSVARLDAVDDWSTKIKSKTLFSFDTVNPSHIDLLHLSINPKIYPNPSENREPTPGAFLSGATDSPSYKLRWPLGSPIPPAYHLVLFPPRVPEQHLSPDGYDSDFSPPSPFVRRMWAGGEFSFVAERGIRIGERVALSVWVDEVERKIGGRGESVFVWENRVVEDKVGPVFVEKRALVYLKEDMGFKEPRIVAAPKDAEWEETIVPTPVMLFRYSALTFNSHLIHYDSLYTQKVEGYPDRLVHGPLTCTLLLNQLHKLLSETKPSARVLKWSYRALSPLIVGDHVTLCGKRTSEADGKTETYELWAVNKHGGLAMRGRAIVAM